ncbi:MAG TPA: bifunctional metallophosphatase/5'-nucleotidase [Flavisolibacter sp.]
MRRPYFLLAAITLLLSCSVFRPGGDDHRLEVIYIQVNDVYEIIPLAAGREGGMARLASLKKNFLRENPNTFMVMAGDFLSPSVYNSIRHDGVPVRGRQMVDAMNAAGMDFAVFGNHEFDIREQELQARIDESRFQWISTNTFHMTGGKAVPFVKRRESGSEVIPVTFIQQLRDADGTVARIGYIGLTLPFTRVPYVSYADLLPAAISAYNMLKDSVDAIVAITHQTVEDDRKLAAALPGLALIMGGHEHDMRLLREGNVYITKAHSNARSAFILKMRVNTRRNKSSVVPDLVYVDESIPLDSATNVVVGKWVDIAEKNFSSLGFDASKVVLAQGDSLDGREGITRNQSTNLTRLIAASVHHAAPAADVAIFNAGSIRVDDILHPPVTQYDLIRTLPYGGKILEVDMKGSLLIRILDQGMKNRGSGGFLHFTPVIFENGHWQIGQEALDPDRVYRVAMNDYLLTGQETQMEFLTPSNPGIVAVHPAPHGPLGVREDIRLAMIDYLSKQSRE